MWPEIKKVGPKQPETERELWAEAAGITAECWNPGVRDWLLVSVWLQTRGPRRELHFWLLTSGSCPLASLSCHHPAI